MEWQNAIFVDAHNLPRPRSKLRPGQRIRVMDDGGEFDASWPCNPKKTYLVHPEDANGLRSVAVCDCEILTD